MGTKLLWTGATLILAGGTLGVPIPAVAVVGSVVMVIGLILLWLDK